MLHELNVVDKVHVTNVAKCKSGQKLLCKISNMHKISKTNCFSYFTSHNEITKILPNLVKLCERVQFMVTNIFQKPNNKEKMVTMATFLLDHAQNLNKAKLFVCTTKSPNKNILMKKKTVMETDDTGSFPKPY